MHLTDISEFKLTSARTEIVFFIFEFFYKQLKYKRHTFKKHET